MIDAIVLSSIGLLFLYFGAETLVRGGTSLGLRFGLSPFIVGVTIVGFGTSAPEMAVSMSASAIGKSDVAIGNVIGSNIANIGLVLGLIALLRPIQINPQVIQRELPIVIASGLLFCLLIWDGNISRLEGYLLLLTIILYIFFNIRQRQPIDSPLEEYASISTLKSSLFILLGLTLLTVGGKWLVDGAVNIAHLLGISESIIALTIVAIGTSLPELATSIVAATKNMSDLSLGNIVGSNVFNTLGVLGASAVVLPLPQGSVTWSEINIMLGFTIVLWLLARHQLQINRWKGGLLFFSYTAYIIWLISQPIA